MSQPKPLIHEIREIMVKSVLTLRPSMKVYEAAEFLIKHRISGAPLVDHSHNVLSVIGEGDLLRLAASEGLEATLAHCLPKLVSLEKMITLSEHATFADAYRIFLKDKIHRIPIVDNKGYLLGLVSRSTILEMFVEAHHGKKIVRKPIA